MITRLAPTMAAIHHPSDGRRLSDSSCRRASSTRVRAPVRSKSSNSRCLAMRLLRSAKLETPKYSARSSRCRDASSGNRYGGAGWSPPVPSSLTSCAGSGANGSASRNPLRASAMPATRSSSCNCEARIRHLAAYSLSFTARAASEHSTRLSVQGTRRRVFP